MAEVPALEFTGRCLLPESLLNEVMQSNNEQRTIMQFAIQNPITNTVVYAGVKDFTSRPTQIVLPYWMMSFLHIEEGGIVTVTLPPEGRLKTATRATFRPEDKSFSDLPNTRVILEKALREHPCLTQGTVFPVLFNDNKYYLRVLQLEPDKHVSAFRADLATDFAPHVSEFNHGWALAGSDSDSSSDRELIRASLPKTLKGAQVTPTTPLRSTLAKREEERRTQPPPAGVTLFQAGQPIAPPTAPEAKRRTASEAFKGPGKFVKRKKGSDQAPAVKSEAPKAPPPPPQGFKGRPRTIKDPVAPAPQETDPAAPAPEVAPAPASAPASAFVGTGHSLKSPPVAAAPPPRPQGQAQAQVQAQAQAQAQAQTRPQEEEQSASAFKGKPRKIGRK
jgi:ubiquitin fusion degradation protein 1